MEQNVKMSAHVKTVPLATCSMVHAFALKVGKARSAMKPVLAIHLDRTVKRPVIA